jgi:hypothetical protein
VLRPSATSITDELNRMIRQLTANRSRELASPMPSFDQQVVGQWKPTGFKPCGLLLSDLTTDCHPPKRLGSGGFGTVYRLQSRDSGGVMAVKLISLPADKLRRTLRNVEKEANLLRDNDHPFVLPFYGIQPIA